MELLNKIKIGTLQHFTSIQLQRLFIDSTLDDDDQITVPMDGCITGSKDWNFSGYCAVCGVYQIKQSASCV